MNYNGYRYYSATLGRFINEDPLEESGGMNLYQFAYNSPLNFVDILGLISGAADDSEEEEDARLEMVGSGGLYGEYAYNKEMRNWNKKHRDHANCEAKQFAKSVDKEAAMQLMLGALAPEVKALGHWLP